MNHEDCPLKVSNLSIEDAKMFKSVAIGAACMFDTLTLMFHFKSKVSFMSKIRKKSNVNLHPDFRITFTSHLHLYIYTIRVTHSQFIG